MRHAARVGDVAVSALLIFAFSASHSYAYLDPGTGSMLLTGILGIFAAITYSMRRFFYRITRVFRGPAKDDAED